MELRQVLLALGEEWSVQEEELEDRLLAEGVRCIRSGGGRLMNVGEWLGSAASSAVEDETETTQAAGFNAEQPEQRRGQTDGLDAADTLVVTDDRGLTATLAKRGFVCVGCDDREGRFFEGAALVTDAPGVLDARTLEECLLRGTGRPVTIAVTNRLIIREITERDIPELYQISRQSGMRMAMEDTDGDCFEPERMAAYIRHAYRFCGYGLWSVLLRDETLVGCCGFRDFAEDYAGWQESRGQEKAAGQTEEIDGNARYAQREDELPTRLELQYVVAEKYRRQGYGEEMCRAALEYARRSLHTDQIWIRAKTDNWASRALAQKLGFALMDTDGSGIAHWRRPAGEAEDLHADGHPGE